MNPALPIVKRLLNHAIELHATDLHFFPSKDKAYVYVRILGIRKFLRSIPTSQYELLLTYFKFSAGMDIGESIRPQDGSTSYSSPALGKYSLRLSTLPATHQESLAIRILPQQEILPLNKLFLFPNQLQKLKEWTNYDAGLILITGPTGSGKSTTLYALIEALTEDASLQTITLEDPVEKKLEHVIQVEINEKAGITYHSGLKAALRHDPDLLMIGEIRDEKTAQFVLQASLTGHLVLSTLHAKNSIGTVHRLLEMGIKQEELLQSLLAVAAIELVPIMRQGKRERAAILELLDGEKLEEVIRTRKKEHFPSRSFQHLRRKAYAYGFIPEAFL